MRVWRFVLADGREIEAATPTEVFECLRRQEAHAPAELGRYLELLRRRLALGLGLEIEVGRQGVDIHERCETALMSLMETGWLRLSHLPVRRSAQVGEDLAGGVASGDAAHAPAGVGTGAT